MKTKLPITPYMLTGIISLLKNIEKDRVPKPLQSSMVLTEETTREKRDNIANAFLELSVLAHLSPGNSYGNLIFTFSIVTSYLFSTV